MYIKHKEMETEKVIRNKFTKIQTVISDGGCFVHLFQCSFFCFYKHVLFPYLGENGNTKVGEAFLFYPKGAWRWESAGGGMNVRRRCWVPGPLPNVLSCLLPLQGLPGAGHVPGVDVKCEQPLLHTSARF